jgi:four helix bundle protein
MNEKIFKDRTKKLAILRLVDDMPRSISADVLARQIVRSGTSIRANYRAACRAKSTADMIIKLKIVEEESDEIIAMTVASLKTLRSRKS